MDTFFSIYDTPDVHREKIKIIREMAEFVTRGIIADHGFGRHKPDDTVIDYHVALNSALMEIREPTSQTTKKNAPELQDAMSSVAAQLADGFSWSFGIFISNLRHPVAPKISKILPHCTKEFKNAFETALERTFEKQYSSNTPIVYWEGEIHEIQPDVQSAFDNCYNTYEKIKGKMTTVRAIGYCLGQHGRYSQAAYEKAQDNLLKKLAEDRDQALMAAISFGAVGNEDNLNKALARLVEARICNPNDSIKASIIQYLNGDLNHPGSYSLNTEKGLAKSIELGYKERFESPPKLKAKKKSIGP